jgi:hypothetical protein
LSKYCFPFIPTAVGKYTINVPEVTSNAKSSSPNVVDDVICLVGNVIPPNDIIPRRATNSFAIIIFFFPYPKENEFSSMFIKQ